MAKQITECYRINSKDKYRNIRGKMKNLDFDDTPRKQYFATDIGNNTPIGKWAFILKEEGNNASPVRPHAIFKVMCVK